MGKKLNANLAIIDKRRPRANESIVMNIIGDVSGKNCLVLDDMIDTGGTICKGAQALLANGAKSVICCATHAVLSGGAMNNLNSTDFKEVVLSNTIQIEKASDYKNLNVLSVAPIFAKAIRRIHNEESISSLFI